MAHVGGVIASAILGVVSKQIMSAIKGQIKLQWNFVSDLQKMRSSLQTVEALLEDAERRSITDLAVRLWLGRLKDAMYEISHMIDDFEVNSEPAAQKWYPQTTVSRLKMANKMKNMREQLKGITEDRIPFTFMQETAPRVQEVCYNRETTAAVTEARVVGRDKEKLEIMARLSGSITKEITILPIYGIGGIGKTTMAQLVFKDSEFKEYSRVWVYVSETFDLKKIGNSIISQLSNSNSQYTDLQMIENNLQTHLSVKSVLIILDDLWEREPHQLERLKTMLELGEGSKVVVVVTTRDEYIAQKNQTVGPYKLAPLTDDICWTIIKDKTSFEARTDRALLELVGMDIAKKCAGLALAARSIGYMLDSMEFDEWVSVNNSELWDVLASEGYSPHHVHASLLLSYRSMSSYLKLCFGYCAIFPKGHFIAKEVLVHQWIALGLVEPLRALSNKYSSDKYINQLLGMSFLEQPKLPWLGDDGSIFFIMHDLVHDLARSVMADEIDIDVPTCRYAWLTDQRKLFNSAVIPLAKIRALHFHDPGNFQLNGDAFSPAKCLRVLDLSRYCTQELPDSIGQLKQLRYLDASWKLNFSVSPPESIRIPKALGALTKLQYLNLSRRRELIGLPKVISKLMELRYLNISTCTGYHSLGIPSANQTFIDCIGALPNLEQLDLSLNNYGFSVPESFSSLKKLNLYGCNRIASIPENVAKVDIQRLFGLLEPVGNENIVFNVREGYSESSSTLFFLNHTNPNVLHIFNLENVKSVEEARSIRLMEKQNIESLSLLWCRRVDYLKHMELLTELVPPINVKHLRIIGYVDAIFPYWVMDISKYLPNLVSLEMSHSPCSSLPPLVQLPNLREIILGNMSNLQEFNTTYSMGEDGANELSLPKLEYLKMYKCPKLRIKPCPPRAEYWHVSQCDNVLSSWGECASSTSASSSSSPVNKLEVKYSSLPLHKWRLLHNLPGLSDLTIAYCNDLTISPEIGRAFTSLESLSLEFNSLQNLPEWFSQLTSLRQLNLKGMHYLQKLHLNLRQPTQLQYLNLDNCDTLVLLPQWLGGLTLLKTLEIRFCKSIISLPERLLIKLQELRISNCPQLYECLSAEAKDEYEVIQMECSRFRMPALKLF
ncbi:disease resistance protein RGA2-like [Triticum aestivum]|uniref:disease resistance protein RGA2-like n=1 Tax=Triticum aestivum TaxID=4565 RepID=UPI001D00BBA8|nr:disease resistance protein RGA2-like [Triticum aestivum]